MSLAFCVPSAEGTRPPCSHLRPDPVTTSLTLWQKAGWQQSFLKKAQFIVGIAQLGCLGCSHLVADKTLEQSPRRRVEHFSFSNSDKWFEMRARISKVKISSLSDMSWRINSNVPWCLPKITKHFIDITNKEGNEVNCTLSWRALFIWLINELCKGVANGFPAGNREFKSIANCCMDAGWYNFMSRTAKRFWSFIYASYTPVTQQKKTTRTKLSKILREMNFYSYDNRKLNFLLQNSLRALSEVIWRCITTFPGWVRCESVDDLLIAFSNGKQCMNHWPIGLLFQFQHF